MYQPDWSILLGEGGRLLLDGALVTLELSGFALVLALVLGFLFGVLRWSEIKPLRPVCWVYVEFLRNTPPLVQLLFWYFSASVILPAGMLTVLRDYGFQFVAAVFALGPITRALSPRSCAAASTRSRAASMRRPKRWASAFPSRCATSCCPSCCASLRPAW